MNYDEVYARVRAIIGQNPCQSDLKNLLEREYCISGKRRQEMFWKVSSACKDTMQTLNYYDYMARVYA